MVKVDFCQYDNFCVILDWRWQILRMVRTTQVYLHQTFKIQATVFISALNSPFLHGVFSVGGLTEKVSDGQNVLGWMELSKNWPSSRHASWCSLKRWLWLFVRFPCGGCGRCSYRGNKNAYDRGLKDNSNN